MTVKTCLPDALLAASLTVVLIGGSAADASCTGGREIKPIAADRVVPLQQLEIVSDMYAANVVTLAQLQHRLRDAIAQAECAGASGPAAAVG